MNVKSRDILSLLDATKEDQPYQAIVKSSISGIVIALYIKIIHRKFLLETMVTYLVLKEVCFLFKILENFNLRKVRFNKTAIEQWSAGSASDCFEVIESNKRSNDMGKRGLIEPSIHIDKELFDLLLDSDKLSRVDKMVLFSNKYYLSILKLTIITVILRGMNVSKHKINNMFLLGYKLPKLSINLN